MVVTGAGGNVGSAVVESLVERNVHVRVAVRTPVRTSERFGGSVASVHLDFLDPGGFRRVLEGASAMFLVRPPAIARVGPTLNRFIDTARACGVGHVVFSSVAGAGTNRLVPHHRVERHLAQSGLDWTILRPGFFAQNLATAYRRDIVFEDRLFLPAGRGKVAFVDTRDLGEAAAVALTDPGLRNTSHHLTGPVAVDFAEVADLLTQALGRPIRYRPCGRLEYYRHVRGQGSGVSKAVVQTLLHAGLRRGDAEEVTDDLPRLLGRPARGIGEYIADHGDLWQFSG